MQRTQGKAQCLLLCELLSSVVAVLDSQGRISLILPLFGNCFRIQRCGLAPDFDPAIVNILQTDKQKKGFTGLRLW